LLLFDWLMQLTVDAEHVDNSNLAVVSNGCRGNAQVSSSVFGACVLQREVLARIDVDWRRWHVCRFDAGRRHTYPVFVKPTHLDQLEVRLQFSRTRGALFIVIGRARLFDVVRKTRTRSWAAHWNIVYQMMPNNEWVMVMVITTRRIHCWNRSLQPATFNC